MSQPILVSDAGPSSLHSHLGKQHTAEHSLLTFLAKHSCVASASAHNNTEPHADCPLCKLVLARLPARRRLKIGPHIPSSQVASIYVDNNANFLQIHIHDSTGRRCGSVRPVFHSLPLFYIPKELGVEGSAAHPGQIRHWLQHCEQNHGPLCNLGNFATARYRLFINITLIDVVEECLIETSSDARYIALSYVWGATVIYTATRQNFRNLHTRGSLTRISAVPNVVRDSMAFTRRLKERYLWVDHLCIVQDDSTKHRHLAQMDVIFSHALLTIAAVDGNNASMNLPGVSYGSRLPVTSRITLQQQDYISEPPSLHSCLSGSVYETRGWTLQERALSRRVLYISDQQMYFQCNTSIRSESHPNEKKRKPLNKHAVWTIGQRLNEIRLRGSLTDQSPADQMFTELVPSEQLSREYWLKELTTYQDLVEVYSIRTLTYPVDVLNAFAGFTSVFEDCCGGVLVFGLPVRMFTLALLWSGQGEDSFSRRRINGQTSGFPSWSWTGWVGKIKYHSLLRLSETHREKLTSLFSRLEQIEISIKAKAHMSNGIRTLQDKGSGRQAVVEQDISQVNEPSVRISVLPLPIHSPSHHTLSFRAPIISCSSHFTFTQQQSQGSPSSDRLFIYQNTPTPTPCGVILDFHVSELTQPTEPSLFFVLICHDFNQFRRTQLRTTYRIPPPTAVSGDTYHSMNLLMVRHINGSIYERVAVAKIYSEAWPKLREGEDQKRDIVMI